MKFLHTADLHIDSPLQTLEVYAGAPTERLQSATRDAFRNVVQLALEESIDFVLIAGDLFDGDWRNMQTGLWANQQFRRLQEAEIPVYLIRGNHDAASEVTRRITWPDNVKEFLVDEPQTIIDERLGVALHGRGFPTRSVDYDLTGDYPRAIPDLFNIGLLHTSLAGDPQHDTYAPANPDRLALSGYDYWALGHVHAHQIINRQPWIVYPGNVQGRHFRECGPKGCVVVTVDEEQQCDVTFHETDVVRWHIMPVDLEDEHDLDDLIGFIRQQLASLVEAAASRHVIVRAVVSGPCRLHRRLQNPGDMERVRAELHNVANEIGHCWLGQIHFDTQPLVDVEALRRGNDLLGELLQDFEQLMTGPESNLASLTSGFDVLKTMATSTSGNLLEQAGIDIGDAAQVRRWLGAAEGHLISLLQEQEDSEPEAVQGGDPTS